MITKFKKPVAASGSTIENEPVIKSDAASSDVMEWAASTGSSSIKIRENSANDLVLDVEGNLELADRVASITSSITVGAVFLYDTSQDSDSGKWRKKCKGLSWFDEGSSTTRSARSEFPAMALIVADNAATPTVTIYDLDDPAMPMWMVFSSEASGDTNHFWRYGDATSIAALNGRIIVSKTTAGGSCEFRLVEDKTWNNGSSGTNQMLGAIVDRNSGLGWGTVDASRTTVNSQHNDVAMTVLEGAEIGALGLPIPTVAVSTANGNSIIHPNGDVYDLSDGASSRAYSGCRFRDNGDLFTWSTQNGTAQSWYRSQFYADTATWKWKYATADDANLPHPLADSTQVIEVGGDSVFTGGDNGLSIIKENLANPAEGMVTHITSTYNTGYMVGDIRGAWLAGNGTADEEREDRSVKGNDLAETGTVPSAVVATDAELYGYGPFSASNYLSRATDTDFDFTDGIFSVMAWVKVVATSDYQAIINRATSADTGKGWYLYLDGLEKAYFKVWGASAVSSGLSGVLSEGWHFLVGVSDGAKVKIYTDGVLANSATLAAGDMTNGDAPLHIGIHENETSYDVDSSLSLLRISATAPTPQQIKEIYDAEKPLFAEDAKCLLAANQVNDLAYDKTSGLLHVASESTASSKSFRGLEAVESLTSDGSLGLTAATEVDGITAAGGVIAAYDNAKAGVNLPSIDVRASLLEGESKLPDDGKLHFEGVTTDATPTVIGQIPIGDNEAVIVTASIHGWRYDNRASSWYASGKIIQQFYRALGGDVYTGADVPETSKLTSEGVAALDVDLDPNSTSNTVQLKVTGSASAIRMQWKASVEVQRISNKTYER
jgi:hypothetical protein